MPETLADRRSILRAALLAGATMLAVPAAAQSTVQTPPAAAAPAALPDASADAAQDAPSAAPAAPSPAPGDVVVTAQRRTQRLQDVPVAVSVVSGASLEQNNIKSLNDLSVRLPSVKITSGVLVDYLNIRGVGSGTNAGFEQSVGTFVDGVYRARGRALRAALFDVDQVEVLKGPQSIFFGANTVAGALNITTRKPGHTLDYNASALYGSDNEYNVEAGLSAPLTDTLSARIVGRANGMDGYVKVANLGDGPRIRNYQGRVALRFEPTSTFRSDLRVEGGTTRTGNAFPFKTLNCPPAAVFPYSAATVCGKYVAYEGGSVDNTLDLNSVQSPTSSKYDYYEVAWTNSLDLGAVSLNSITSYFHHRADDRLNQDPVPIHSPVVDGYDAFPFDISERYHQFAQELRLQSRAGGVFEYMVGGYYSTSSLTYLRTAGFNFSAFGAIPAVAATGTTAATPITAETDLFQSDRTLSAFASATIRPVAGLRINLGARYTSVEKDGHRNSVFGTSIDGTRATFAPLSVRTQTVLGGVLGTDLTDFPQTHREDHKFMPSAGVQYDVSRGVMTYFTYAQGFKAGGYNSNSFALTFGPEFVDSYEVGVKGQFLDRRLTVNADIFRSDYTNLQETSIVFLSSGLTASLVANVAGSRSQGIEGNISFALTPAIRFNTDLTYLDAIYTDYTNGACTQAATAAGCKLQDLSGKTRGFAPRFAGNAGVDVTVPAGNYVVAISPVVYFSSRYFQSATADPTLEQIGYTKFDLRVGVGPSDRKWDVSLIGKNLTNAITASYRQPLTGSLGSVVAVADRGRAVFIQLSIKK